MDVASLKGIAVVSVKEGAKLGRVEDLLFDTRALKVAALRAKGDGQAFVVPFEQVKNIGADAVMVESSQVTQAASQGGPYSGLPGLDQLKRLKVVDDNGTFLGAVGHVEFDPVTGRLDGLSAHKGGVFGLGGATTALGADAIVSIGTELITVREDAIPRPEQPEQADQPRE
ncbi:MAG TPA: PRC-barrel domain-containing protein [Thermomicrobiales bacterium]|nr:PRC-barrel domain-containing protein [Thermomicrobiales bacterium]